MSLTPGKGKRAAFTINSEWPWISQRLTNQMDHCEFNSAFIYGPVFSQCDTHRRRKAVI
jgi:hypothetical protein